MNFPQGGSGGGQPAATTTTTVTETHVQTNLRWDPSYIKTVPGILKGVAVVRLIKFFLFSE